VGELASEFLVTQAFAPRAQPEEATGCPLHVGTPLIGRKCEVGCSVSWAAGKRAGLGVLSPNVAKWLLVSRCVRWS